MDYIERHLLNQGRTVTTTTASLSNSGSGSGSSTSIPGGSTTAGVASAARKQELAIEALTLAYTVSPTFTPTPSQVLLAQQYKQALTTMHDKVGRSYKPLSVFTFSYYHSSTHLSTHPFLMSRWRWDGLTSHYLLLPRVYVSSLRRASTLYQHICVQSGDVYSPLSSIRYLAIS